MANRSHYNSGLRTLVQQPRDGVWHSSAISANEVAKTYHALYIQDAIEFLKSLPEASVQ